ncbi:MAG: hypothetical protein K2P14_08315 [Anaeroplasmataceae bacterium]|nr:hypothetical protein [Anaeroplasmataceae bacterium]
MRDYSNLRKNAKFSTQVYKGVIWVPLNTLGKSKLCGLDIRRLLLLKKIHNDYNEIIKKVNTLYDAIQYLQKSNYKNTDDNQFTYEDGVNWEHHTSGYESLRNNGGCCASVAAAICTLLKDNYDIVNMIVVIALNGSCHVLNYIENCGKKYIVDAYAMTNEYKKYVPLETGELKDFVSAKLHTGVLLEIDSLQSFFDFYRRYFIKRKDCYDFFQIDGGRVPSISLDRRSNCIELMILGSSMKLISKDKKEHDLIIKNILQ